MLGVNGKVLFQGSLGQRGYCLLEGRFLQGFENHRHFLREGLLRLQRILGRVRNALVWPKE